MGQCFSNYFTSDIAFIKIRTTGQNQDMKESWYIPYTIYSRITRIFKLFLKAVATNIKIFVVTRNLFCIPSSHHIVVWVLCPSCTLFFCSSFVLNQMFVRCLGSPLSTKSAVVEFYFNNAIKAIRKNSTELEQSFEQSSKIVKHRI